MLPDQVHQIFVQVNATSLVDGQPALPNPESTAPRRSAHVSPGRAIRSCHRSNPRSICAAGRGASGSAVLCSSPSRRSHRPIRFWNEFIKHSVMQALYNTTKKRGDLLASLLSRWVGIRFSTLFSHQGVIDRLLRRHRSSFSPGDVERRCIQLRPERKQGLVVLKPIGWKRLAGHRIQQRLCRSEKSGGTDRFVLV